VQFSAQFSVVPPTLLMMLRYLVLGSSGFIGNNFCNYLRSRNCIVSEFDIKNNEDEDLRITNNSKLRNAIESCDFVFFLAFDVGGSKFLQNCNHDNTFLTNNTKILGNTFEILAEFDKKFIFISSYLTKNLDHSYGLLKFLGEQFTHSLGGLVVRLYNIYGNEEVSIRSHVIPDLIYQAQNNNCIELKTNGEEKRQFLYIDDCCEGLFVASQQFDLILRECNNIDLTYFEWISIKNIASFISERFNCPLKISQDKANYNSEIAPNRYILKFWKPRINLEFGISLMLNELKN